MGRVISKKNSKRIFRMGKRTVIAPSQAYEVWELQAKMALKRQSRGEKFVGVPLRIECVFQIKGKYHVDVDNSFTSICDLLQVAGIIDDDDWVVEAVLKKQTGCGDFSTQISIQALG